MRRDRAAGRLGRPRVCADNERRRGLLLLPRSGGVMESKITVNGVDYDRVEDMPADVREIYEKAMGQARPQLPGLNLTLAEHHTTQHGGAVKQTFFVNGKTYDSEQDMPADVREQ